uniref:RING-type domain-containing protein n=1 Tax=Kwoniella dejecticola CBS 10117 TaxID=1296121 RepID=A0A1A5ZVB7_9TREE|nr:uncharacterized protein I303_07660 [Kwoniella dejecticola CBS 10117]OBR81750.1 hypothetical protein I303_07660 [Kwoniella dejecticola CBS 10117]
MPAIATPKRKKAAMAASQPYSRDYKLQQNDSSSSRTSSSQPNPSSNTKSQSHQAESSLLKIIQDVDNRIASASASHETSSPASAGAKKPKKKKIKKAKQASRSLPENQGDHATFADSLISAAENTTSPVKTPASLPVAQLRETKSDGDVSMQSEDPLVGQIHQIDHPPSVSLDTANTSQSPKDNGKRKKKKDRQRERERQENLDFVAEYNARVEKRESEEQARRAAEQERRARALRQEEDEARGRVEKLRETIEELNNQATVIRRQIADMEREKLESQAQESEDKKRRSEQDLAKVREERRRHKDMEDKVTEAESAAREWKAKYENQQAEDNKRMEEDKGIIDQLRKDAEKMQQDNQSNEVVSTIMKEHEDTRKAIIEALECKICLTTIDDAYITSCGHMACKHCMVSHFRSPHAYLHGVEGITEETDLSYRTKVCFVCRSAITRKPARVFPLRDILGPLGEYKHKDPPKETDPDPWEKIFPADHEGYKLYDKADDIMRCPECLGELMDDFCSGCDIIFSDAGEDVDVEVEEESEAEVIGSVLGEEDVIRVDGPGGLVDDQAEFERADSDEDGTSTSTSGSDDDNVVGTPGRIRRGGGAPPPPPPGLNNLLTILTEGEGDYVGTEMSSEDEREEDSEDEYGGSFIDDDGSGHDEEDEEEEDDISMIDVQGETEGSEEERPRAK